MLGVIDRPLIVALSGLILSFLESAGVLSPSYHDSNLQIVQAAFGGILAIVTIISYYVHHTAVINQKIAAGVQDPPTGNSFIQTFKNGIRSFIFSQSQTKTTTTTEVTPVTE